LNKIRNKPTINGGIIDLNRSMIEHRASWLALIFDEALKAGADAETFTRKAVFRMGCQHGNELSAKLCKGDSLIIFEKTFLNGLAIKTFEMETLKSSDDELIVEFGYCPLLSAWQKLGFSDDRNYTLCDIAMEGDRGIAESLGYHLVLQQTLASGDKKCRIKYERRHA